MEVDMQDGSKEAEVKEKLKSIIDVNSPDFQSQVRQLATAIGMEGIDHPDPTVLLKAIVVYVDNALEKQTIQPDTSNKPKIDIKDVPLGIKSSGNPETDSAIKILRLLNVEQLRRLQTQVNILTVEVQKVTANPKTDLQLGKIGR